MCESKFWGCNRPKSKLVSGKTGFFPLKSGFSGPKTGFFGKFFAKMFKNVKKGLLYAEKYRKIAVFWKIPLPSTFFRTA